MSHRLMHRIVGSSPWLYLVVALAGCYEAPVERPVAPPVEWAVSRPFDHHVHLLSPTLVADWKSLGVPFSRPDEAYVSSARLLAPVGPERTALLSGAFLVSMGHVYGHPEFHAGFGFPIDVEQARVRGENDHVAAEAARNPDRAVAFCSVPILRPYADEEGMPATTDDEAAAMGADLRRLGLDRVVFGSDSPVFRPDEYAGQLADRSGLAPEELDRILANRVIVDVR